MVNVFHWRMDGRMHERQLLILRADIIRANNGSADLAIADILPLLPAPCDQASAAAARGAIRFVHGSFSNRADTELFLTFTDPALDTLSLTLPAEWRGSINDARGEVTIVFDPALELEVPKLARLGASRSAFQLLEKVVLAPNVAVCFLRDTAESDKETWVEAKLHGDYSLAVPPHNVRKYARQIMAGGNGCTPDPNERAWYLVRRNNDGLCFIQYGQIIVGGQVAYSTLWGPDTYAACEEKERLLCGGSSDELARLRAVGVDVSPG